MSCENSRSENICKKKNRDWLPKKTFSALRKFNCLHQKLLRAFDAEFAGGGYLPNLYAFRDRSERNIEKRLQRWAKRLLGKTVWIEHGLVTYSGIGASGFNGTLRPSRITTCRTESGELALKLYGDEGCGVRSKLPVLVTCRSVIRYN